MSNFINPSILASMALDQLEYELVAGQLLYRDRTNEFANVRGLKVGDMVSIRTVTDFVTDEFVAGGGINTQEINQSATQLMIEKHFDTSVKITARERALNLDGVVQEIIRPSMVSMAQKIDTYLLSKVGEAQGLYASNTLLADAADIAQARKQANLQQISKAGRLAIVSNDLEAVLLGKEVFHKYDTRGDDAEGALREADMGRLMGIDWYSSVNFPALAHTAGTGATTLNNGAGANNVQGMTDLTVAAAANFLAGDKIIIAGAKRQFTAAANGAGTVIPLVEQINENLQDLNGAAVSVAGSGQNLVHEGLIFNPQSFGYAAPPLDPAAGDLAGVASANGLSIRMTESYDHNQKETFWSFDLLLGAKAVDARGAMILSSY